MIPIDTRIYRWLLQMTNARISWSEKKVDAEHDKYLESIEYHYNGINIYLK